MFSENPLGRKIKPSFEENPKSKYQYMVQKDTSDISWAHYNELGLKNLSFTETIEERN